MTGHSHQTLRPMLRKLQLWKTLNDEETQALVGLPHQVRTFAAGDYIVRQGDKPQNSCLLLSGFSYRQKVARDGGRSISAVHMKGDIVDLQNSVLGYADHSVQAMTTAEIAVIPREAIVDIAFRFPKIGLAMWYDTLVDGSIFREWILNISRRDASTRIAHLLCELGVRLEVLHLGDRSNYDVPMTQDQIADACGLTAVHVNRSLMDLESRGLIERRRRHITVANWSELQRAADFDDSYLHLKQMAR